MSKVIYHDRQKSVFLSYAEVLLVFAAEFGVTLLDAFFPAKYPETWWTRRLLGLDSVTRSSLRVARHRLIRRGLVAKRANKHYVLTPQGQRTAAKLLAAFRARGEHRSSWDRKWRLLVFDIPEIRKKYRDGLRRVLTEAGYLRLQDSVWVGKYPLPDEVIEFIETCNLGRHIYIFLSDTVDREEDIYNLFEMEKSQKHQ